MVLIRREFFFGNKPGAPICVTTMSTAAIHTKFGLCDLCSNYFVRKTILSICLLIVIFN
jgi:hypothetical protein